MVIEQLAPLSIEEKKQAILRMSQFVLRDSSENVRDALYRRMLEIGLYIYIYLNGKRELRDILDTIRDQFFGIQLDENAVREYLKKLEQEGSIRQEEGKFSLEEELKLKFESYSKSTLELISSCEKKFVDDLATNAKKELSPEETHTVALCFYHFVVKLVSRYILATAKMVVKGVLSRIFQSSGENLVDSVISQCSDASLKEALEKTFFQWMQSPDDKFVEYLFVMRQNLVCLEILSLDPECRLIAKEEFSKKRLFLDTNILLKFDYSI